MLYQAVFSKWGEHVYIPVEGDTWEQAQRRVRRENPTLDSWSLSVKHVKPGGQAKDDQAELKYDV